MSNILTHTGDEPFLIAPKALRRLLERGDGDAALLYLALLRHQGTLSPRSLLKEKELRWEPERMDAAETVLREIGLVTSGSEPRDEPAQQDYRQDELAFQLENNPDFLQLTAQVESRLGKRLSPADLSKLLFLLNELDLPSDVIYTLVNHCVERYAASHGAGQRPKMSEITRTGTQWYNMGITTQAAAAEYLKRYARQQAAYAGYMRVLELGDRLPVKSEEKYLSTWHDMGFPPETVALAYEKTVLNCQKFKWNYCNGILRRWDADGLHTPAEVENEEPLEPSGKKKSGKAYQTDENEVAKYVRQLQEKIAREQDGDDA
ncbi:MAG: DnaD domain protein [Oscillibacter sp.]|nr:DnaD domain protein [Oscillibacter sp.]